MQIALLIIIFLEAALIFLLARTQSKSVERLIKRFDSREKDLLDRLMIRSDSLSASRERIYERTWTPKDEPEEELPEIGWREF